MKIARKALKKIDGSATVKGKLADAFKRSHQTIQRWIDNADDELLNLKALKIYEEELGITQKEAVQE